MVLEDMHAVAYRVYYVKGLETHNAWKVNQPLTSRPSSSDLTPAVSGISTLTASLTPKIST